MNNFSNPLIRLSRVQLNSLQWREFHDKVLYTDATNAKTLNEAAILRNHTIETIDKKRFHFFNAENDSNNLYRFDTRPPEQITKAKGFFPKSFENPEVIEYRNLIATYGGLVSLTSNPENVSKHQKRLLPYLNICYLYKIDIKKLLKYCQIIKIPTGKKTNLSELITDSSVPLEAIISYQKVENGKLIGEEKPFKAKKQSNRCRTP